MKEVSDQYQENNGVQPGDSVVYDGSQLDGKTEGQQKAASAAGIYDPTTDVIGYNTGDVVVRDEEGRVLGTAQSPVMTDVKTRVETAFHEGDHRISDITGQPKTEAEVAQTGQDYGDAWTRSNNRNGNSANLASVSNSQSQSNAANAGYGSGVVNGMSDDVEALPYTELVQVPKLQETVQNNFGTRWRDPNSRKNVSKTPVDGWKKSHHDGTDISAPEGSVVNAAREGVVESVGKVGGYGNTIVIKHIDDSGRKFWTLGAHFVEPSTLTVGEKVEEGQKIGEVGNTGANSSGPHLHFGVNNGDNNGSFSWKKGWLDPQVKNFGKYEKLEDTPGYKKGLSQ